jgi:histidinol-phosphate/aromatic aminotransferase/cobyric acid decarboxylase-like protein
LSEKLGCVLKCDPHRLLVLQGLAQLLPVIRRRYAERSVVLPTHSPSEYRRVFTDARYVDDVDEGQSRDYGDVVVVLNPHPLTGTVVESQLSHARARKRPGVLFVVDETALAFSDQPSLVRLLEDDPLDNVIVLTDLRARLGVPGLNLGFAYWSDLDAISALGVELPTRNLSSAAEFLLELCIKFEPAYLASLERTKRDRDALGTSLRELEGVADVISNQGNFVLVRLTDRSQPFAERVRVKMLERHRTEVGVIDAGGAGATARLRMILRRDRENDGLVVALRDVLAEFAA